MGEVRRKKIRLPASAYEHGWYFVTICTQARMKVLAQIRPVSVGADDSVRPCGVLLTPLGSIVRECLERLSDDAAGISVDKYVIMPNHIHVIICIDGRTESSAPTAADAAFQIHYHTAGLGHGIYKALATLLL